MSSLFRRSETEFLENFYKFLAICGINFAANPDILKRNPVSESSSYQVRKLFPCVPYREFKRAPTKRLLPTKTVPPTSDKTRNRHKTFKILVSTSYVNYVIIT